MRNRVSKFSKPIPVELTPWTHSPLSILFGGTLSGVIAGAMSILLALISSADASSGFARQATVVFLFIIAPLYGIAFAFITRSVARTKHALVVGVCFGIVTWLIVTAFVLPLFAPQLLMRLELSAQAWFTAHLIFGAALSLTPFFESIAAPNSSLQRKSGRSHSLPGTLDQRPAHPGL